MKPRHHAVITGTGRAGTSFLVELLTHLGFETGYSIDEIANHKFCDARAGLEHDIRNDHCPYIVKSPHFCDYVDDVITRVDIHIDHVFVPIRDLHAAAESRRHVSKISAAKLPFHQRLLNKIGRKTFAGGLWHTTSNKPGKQEEVLLRQMYKLVLTLSNTDIPVTFLHYPRITKDKEYLFGKLDPLLQHTEYESFCITFSDVVRPQLVHSFNTNDR